MLGINSHRNNHEVNYVSFIIANIMLLRTYRVTRRLLVAEVVVSAKGWGTIVLQMKHQQKPMV